MTTFWALQIFLFSLLGSSLSQPSSVLFTDCSTPDYDPQLRINVSAVYAQLQENDLLKLTILGRTGQPIADSSNATGAAFRATAFVTTSVLTYTTAENATAFCSTLRPPSPLPALPSPDATYCPIPAGDLAFSVTTPYKHHYQLTTVTTRVHVVDSSTPSRDLLCIDAPVTPVSANGAGPTYGIAQVLFWASVILCACYWTVLGLARIAAAWSRGKGRIAPRGFARLQWFGTVLASAISGEHLSSSPALLRFATPSARDVVFHTQWCTALAMVAVQWPKFVYPVLSNTAWATLLFNVTLVQSSKADHWAPLDTSMYSPPPGFADQINDPASPLFLDSTRRNLFFQVPTGTGNGIPSLASAIGLRPQDLFGICLAIFLLITAGAIGLSLVVWAIDWVVISMVGVPAARMNRNRRFSVSTENHLGKELSDVNIDGRTAEDDVMSSGRHTPRPTLARRRWWNTRLGHSSFHGRVLQGNLVRLLLLFHFPITIFSSYQFSLGLKHASAASVALAALAFAVFSILIPALLIARLITYPTSKLYDDSDTLLVLGPLYNQYNQGSQIFSLVPFVVSLIVGVTLGAGQMSGTAQAVIILVVEVASALATSIWLPWGERANMGVMSFIFCVARIVTAVLLVILSPVVSVGNAAGGWIAYAILIIQACVYLGFFIMLVVKTVEGVVRLTGRAPFEKSTRSADTGLIGALGLVGCLETKSRRRRRREDRGKYQAPTLRHGGTATSSQHMLVGAASPRPASPTLDPPSFLRPEQAFQPYKEDNDDETGYIMRAWQPFPPGHVYQPVETPGASTTAAASVSEALPTETPTTTTSGFTRVGGGRARFESPFAITTQGAASSALTQPPPQITTPGSLPPGAKAPRVPSSHFRAESQSAIVEHMGPIGRPGSRLSGVISLSDPPVINDPNTTGNSTPSPKRGWFGLRSASSSSHDPEVEANATRWNIFKSSRGNSEGSGNALDVEPGHEEMGSKSFMVVRKKGANSRAVTPIEGGSITPDRAHPPSSFVVVRPGRPSIPRSNSQAELASLDPRPPRPKMARRPSSSGN